VALLGDAFATEELGFASGIQVARRLETNYGIPRQATNFLRVHGSEDKEHLEAAAQAIERYAGDRDHYADILYATRMTYRRYSQLFTDVLELGDSWREWLLQPSAERRKSWSAWGRVGPTQLLDSIY
jgi:hypothetical protein